MNQNIELQLMGNDFIDLSFQLISIDKMNNEDENMMKIEYWKELSFLLTHQHMFQCISQIWLCLVKTSNINNERLNTNQTKKS